MLPLALFILLFISTPLFAASQSIIDLNFDVQRWKETIENQVEQNGIKDEHKTGFAINVGLETMPELQQVMKDRHQRFVAVSGGPEWPFGDFLEDLTSIQAAAEAYVEKLDNRDLGLNKILNHIIPSPDVAGNTLDTISSIPPPFTRGIKARGLNINYRQVDASTSPHSPFDDIMLHLKSFFDTITDALESIINDAKVTTHDAIVAIHEFIQDQVAFLSKEVQEAIQSFKKFSAEHPWIVASAIVGLVVFGVTIAISPYAYLAILRLVGFGELGPVAGSWAALIQSTVYGGGTSGLFSVIQSIAMTGRIIWPISVFTGIFVVAVGAAAAFWGGDAIKTFVEEWMNQGGASFPILPDGTMVTEELGVWMGALGEKMEQTGVPHGQWFDVVIEALRRRLETF
ncbi:hypothetical protein E1B28_003746 [Marasmius oreades]|uniref:Uncharacterized protein n=1 Tax=Marasmius oreades TaxID=181124 RepID=A0A9P8ABZ2_9AGAR|nr:uncharacterized protein E1B28_003746 [Marasmius oreades]KAG7096300.1 hypothetical protein E1B28_003746 [Marasmius oreades]